MFSDSCRNCSDMKNSDCSYGLLEGKISSNAKLRLVTCYECRIG